MIFFHFFQNVIFRSWMRKKTLARRSCPSSSFVKISSNKLRITMLNKQCMTKVEDLQTVFSFSQLFIAYRISMILFKMIESVIIIYTTVQKLLQNQDHFLHDYHISMKNMLPYIYIIIPFLFVDYGFCLDCTC